MEICLLEKQANKTNKFVFSYVLIRLFKTEIKLKDTQSHQTQYLNRKIIILFVLKIWITCKGLNEKSQIICEREKRKNKEQLIINLKQFILKNSLVELNILRKK